jgi:hypothetical protein
MRNDLDDKILELVKDNPGVPTARLMHEFEMRYGTGLLQVKEFLTSLCYLEDNEYIIICKSQDGFRRYYPIDEQANAQITYREIKPRFNWFRRPSVRTTSKVLLSLTMLAYFLLTLWTIYIFSGK